LVRLSHIEQIAMKKSALFDRFEDICKRLAASGWAQVFSRHGLNIALIGEALRIELLRDLPEIDRQLPGFGDFANEGARGIEPGDPSRSLLYHALSSPHVGPPVVEYYPTLDELDIIENYVFSSRFPSIPELRAQARTSKLAIVVFAVEYRPAIDTVHQKHADLCFSRTGVSRVGTAAAKYVPHLRGFVPFVDGEGGEVRAIAARYAPYIAMQLKPVDAGVFGPLRFQPADAGRNFWVPLHKLFNGRECVRGHEIQLRLTAKHRNEKLRRIHLALMGSGHSTGWSGAALSEPPFCL
jgi:hypothetical protein